MVFRYDRSGFHKPQQFSEFLPAMSDLSTVDDQRHTVLAAKDVRHPARQALRANIVPCVVISVLGAVFIWPILSPSAIISSSYDFLRGLFQFLNFADGETFLADLQTWIEDAQKWTSVGEDSSAGVIHNVYTSIRTSGGIEKAVLYALGNAILGTSVTTSIIAGATVVATMGVTLFARIPLRISSIRFYVESRIYPHTGVSRLLFVFRSRATLAIGWAAIYKYFWLVVWAFTIIGFPIKYYSYCMYDYILAENPHANPRQALQLSKTLMKGNRMRAFLLDLSFVPWYFLGLLSFGLVIYFYASPYRYLAFAEFYTRVRAIGFDHQITGIELCNDPYLTQIPIDESVWVDDDHPLVYPHPRAKKSHISSRMDYRRDYSVINLILLFFCFSFIGWVYESTLSIAYVGHFVNRGTMYGPWIPIYGTGGVVVLVVLKKLRERPFVTFLTAIGLCGVIEYTAATVIYYSSGLTYWNYTGYFFNIQGRVCLEGLLVFGMAASAAVYFMAPLLDTWLNRISLRIRYIIAATLLVGFTTDATMSIAIPRTGTGITD